MRNSFWLEVDYFVDCILNDQAPAVDVREGARNVAACLAGVEAARTRKPTARFAVGQRTLKLATQVVKNLNFAVGESP